MKYPDVPGHEDAATSKAAAASVARTAASMRTKVFRAILEAGYAGMTCNEIEIALGMRHQTASARVRELFLLADINDWHLVRKTRSGRNATVWFA
jgi:predicted transcriptional regulator